MFSTKFIRKVVTTGTPPKKTAKRLQSSQAACPAQYSKPSVPQYSRPASGKDTLAFSSSGPKTPSSFGGHGRGMKF